MATATQETGLQIRPYRLNLRQYLAMIGAGIIPNDAHVELLDGKLVDKMTKFAPHNYTARQLGLMMKDLVGPGWLISEEKSIRLGRHWRPEPDIAVIRGPNSRYRKKDPAGADIGLIIEVADSSYATDRGEKWRAYAAARISAYWIVNLGKSQIEVYTDPIGRGKKASYRQIDIFEDGNVVPIVLEGQDIGRIAVNEVLSR
jgi:Uma2 family endonuclease